MAEQDLMNAFNDCIDRLSAGQSIEDCLRLYPRHAAALRPMLEAGQLVHRTEYSPADIAPSQARVRFRYEQALRSPRRRPVSPYRRLLFLAAAFLLIVVVLSAGLGAVAESSIPGDTLYGFKLFTEGLRLSFLGSTDLSQQFSARRLDEIRQLVLGRTAEATFEGHIEWIDNPDWLVAGLPLQITPDTTGTAGLRTGNRVRVRAYTTPDGRLIATHITLLESGLTADPTATPSHVPTRQPVTNTPSPQPSPTPTATVSRTPAPTSTTTSSPTATITSSPTPSPTPTRTPTPRPSSTACIPAPPPGWVTYSVQPGDSLSSLAASRGTTLAAVMVANCIENPALIVAGQQLYLPPAPPSLATQPSGGNPPPSGNDNNDNDDDDGDNSGHGGGNDNGNDNDNDNDD